ncbi:polymerase [Corallococcus sp. H22C18031201]|uniref:BamA/TamA family outer membrane protein n=1 Tax=Citreicoccus inhibens TaxID=2849499 RepID=UPI000E722AD5|nr:BamA/TamA family outer membrane protein [Citreicoccus inhibens]MBU8897435.1 BamA/TamA family outer membrane protein [Citreicoccus inhibens]RJS16787.1 polymerase [Corallococcus sp. H22C18031201]
MSRSVVAAVFVGAMALLWGQAARAQEVDPEPTQVVGEVVVNETGRTTAATIQGYARVDEGDALTQADLLKVERRLTATGLFQDVRVRTEPMADGRVRLVLEVEDKASWVIAPTFALSSSNVGGGVLYAENNLWGRSKKFAVAAQVSTAESGLFMGYLDPNLFGLPQLKLSLEGQLRSDRVEEYRPGATQSSPEVARRTRLNSASIAGELGVMLFERVRAAAKYRLMLIDARPPSQDTPVTEPAFEPGPSQRDTSLRLMVGIDTRQTLHAVMEGLNLEASYELSSPSVWSEFQYRKFGLLYRHGLRFFEEHNLVLRAEAALGTDLPFQQELVLGGNSLRGFLHRQFRGDTRLSFTAEYHFPLFTIRSLAFRGVGFSDTGLMLWRSIPEDRQLRDVTGRVVRGYLPDAKAGLDGATLAQGVGAGLRLYLRNVVLPLVGVDVAYGVNSGELRFYLVAGVTSS